MIKAQHLYNVNEEGQIIPVILYEGSDVPIHSAEHPNCSDKTCPCNAEGNTQ